MSEQPHPAAIVTDATAANEESVLLVNPATLEEINTEYVPLSEDDPLMKKYHDTVFNGWYPSIEDYVKSMSDECQRQSTMHGETSKLYNRRHQIVTILVILIPFFQGILQLFNLPSSANKVIIGILSAIGILVGSLNKVMKFMERSRIHRTASDKFMSLNSQLEEQVLLPPPVRYNGVLFQRWSRLLVFLLKKLAPYPDKKISKQLGGKVAGPSLLDEKADGGRPEDNPLPEIIVVPNSDIPLVPVDPNNPVAEPDVVPPEGEDSIHQPQPPPMMAPVPVPIPTSQDDAMRNYWLTRKKAVFKADHP